MAILWTGRGGLSTGAGLLATTAVGGTVPTPPAEQGNFSNVPTSVTAPNAISGIVLTNQNVATGYYTISPPGGPEGVRVAFAGNTVTIPAISTTVAGTYVFRDYDAATGGNLLSTATVVVQAAVQSSPGSLPTFTYQATATQPAGTPVTFAHYFAPGDVPSGKYLTATANGQTVALATDQVNTWPRDGSLRCAALSFLLPFAVASGAQVSFQLGTTSTAPSGTPLTAAQITAATNIQMQVTLGNFVADTYTGNVGANNESGSLTGVPAVVQTGATFSIGFSYGGLAGLAVQILNSSGTAVATGTTSGGYPNPGTVTFTAPSAAGSYTIAIIDTGRSPALTVAQSPAFTVQTAAVPVQAYTVSLNDIVANFAQLGSGVTGWGTSYPLGGWELIQHNPACTELRGWRYLKKNSDGSSHSWVKCKIYARAWKNASGNVGCVEVLPGLFDENSYGPHPSGNSSDSRVPIPWVASQADLYNGATRVMSYCGANSPWGNATVSTYPQEGWWGALADGSRPFISLDGSTVKPARMIAHDRAYMIHSRCMAPYDHVWADSLPASQKAGNQADPGYQPNVSRMDSAIENVGDASNDPRYGYLNYDSAALFLNPLDAGRERTVMGYAWSWGGWEQWLCDERSGGPINPGTTASVSPSPPNPTFTYYSNQQNGSPAWTGGGPSPNWHGFSYGPRWDASHMPTLQTMAYLRTADAALEEMLLYTPIACLAAQSTGRNTNGYESAMLFQWEMNGAERAGASFIRQCGIADRTVRDANPWRGITRRALSENARMLATGGIPDADPKMVPLGIFWTLVGQTNNALNGGDGFPHMFMMYLCAFLWGVEARVGDYPGFATFIPLMKPCLIDYYDDANGGDSFHLGEYSPNWSPDDVTPYASAAAAMAANWPGAHPTAISAGLNDGSSAYGTLDLIPLAALLMMGWLDTPVPRAQAIAQLCFQRFAAMNSWSPFADSNGTSFNCTYALALPGQA